jgi:hypothetical protein
MRTADAVERHLAPLVTGLAGRDRLISGSWPHSK